jgi:hypothetical protein
MRKDNMIRVSGFVRSTLIMLFVLYHQRKPHYKRLTESLHQQGCPRLEKAQEVQWRVQTVRTIQPVILV